ncbi:hypothetical protein ACQUY5_16640 [Bacillus cereus]|uniref:hypothetical protein n=1 Tax=Bacillus cereus TaxID=1396 RepID=UPI003D183EF4
MPFYIGNARIGFIRVKGTGQDLWVSTTYKFMGYQEKGKEVVQRHEASIESVIIESVTKYGKVYWNTVDIELTPKEEEYLKEIEAVVEGETFRDVLLRADKCLRDYGYTIK